VGRKSIGHGVGDLQWGGKQEKDEGAIGSAVQSGKVGGSESSVGEG